MNHWLIRVGDGYNLKYGKHAIWGVKRGKMIALKVTYKIGLIQGISFGLLLTNNMVVK